MTCDKFDVIDHRGLAYARVRPKADE